ncbi:MAG TPA: hypothetical protein PK605_14630 [Ignavibacteria bacterium]|nr:hypothetical protein [Bacteroidota bacterium]HRE09975.1 hypothetical protein [Ignavibacteria bacterium]HRF66957.1 hypothetical protein [Ignavibacteria bacterium]HRJ05635.1 hypothetical protein [Ignavibacteria bacterium]HRJ86818.1 hypothetical protein [Ignavibacteria bacterium]
MKKTFLLLLIVSAFIRTEIFAQDSTDYSKMYTSWAMMQIIPSPVIFQDSDGNNSKVQFGLRWQLIPLNISFRSNKFTTPLQFFKINPVRRFTGSMDIFVQPEWTVTGFKYSGLSRFGISAGSRIILPIKGDGEKMAFSLGGKYTHRNDAITGKNGYWSAEGGIYFLFGFVGLQFSYNFDERSRYNIGFFLKYF